MIELPHIELKIPSGTTVGLQLLLHNQSTESLLLHPELEDWVVDGEQIISSISYLAPVYIVLAGREEKSQRMTLEIPSDLKPGQILKNWLRFPGVQEAGIPVKVEIIELDKDNAAAIDLSLKADLPFPTQDSQLSPILGLMSGLIEFDRIPMRWLMAEILVKLCQTGEEYAKSQAGSELLRQLRPTPFFKNGVSALDGVQFSDWIAKSLSSIKSVLNGKKGQGSLLYLWECWWFSLAEVDLEAGESGSTIEVPPFLAEEFVTELGNDGDRWFAALILGLAELSPAIALNLKNIATQIPPISDSLTERSLQTSYNLATGLSGFDLLPVRWLVLEMLLLLNKMGREYLETEPGSKLLTRLSRTRFFKNGVIAFASAQVPRWLAISQSAANAYYESLGVPSNSRGVVYYWENWLWSLGNSARINNVIPSSNVSGNLLVHQWEMDAEVWFGAIALGLVRLSARMSDRIKNITDRAPDSFPAIPQHQVTLDNILDDAISLQR
ncbi:hypothetical protein [Microcoleus sp. herbarium14]|uniref:hypothetical protein n=1 Tax=Microcoleus sp. herbarium14 TaxID=3055439 RepID=UPI002FD42DCE